MNNINSDFSKENIDRITVHMVSLGCAKNLVDSEAMCGILQSNSFVMTDNPLDARVIVVNTCGFIESAKREAIDKILEMSDYKTSPGMCDFLIVAGCLAQRYSGDIGEQIPEVDAILGTSSYGSIANTIHELYATHKKIVITEQTLNLDYLGEKRTPSTRGFAYLKIAEGCSNNCSYCAIPGIRGAFRSRPIYELAMEAKELASSGFYEIVLIAQDTTRYGTDIYGRQRLVDLLRTISDIEEVRKVRILYCYSDGITQELIDEIRDNPKIAKYIEMPIQHASDTVLKRMNRRDTAQSIEANVTALRDAIPDITIRTTVLVGFPGESEAEFNEMYTYLERVRFDLLGCFVFSSEEGTPAANMSPKVNKVTANSRHDAVMNLQQKISFEKGIANIGKSVKITVESIADDGIFYSGRSDAQAPEIDPPICVTSEYPLNIGSEYTAKLVDYSNYEMIGVITDEFAE